MSAASEHEPLVDRPAEGRIFHAHRRVRLGDCSPSGRVRLDACARFLQDIANDDSRDAGSPNPTAWVARRTVIRVDRFAQYLDMVALSTWCSGLGPRWAERRYSMASVQDDDASGSATRGRSGRIEANTLWVHIDMVTMKPVPVPADFAGQFATAANGRQVKARLYLPLRPPGGEMRVTQWPVRFADFDVLGHVNNSIYWAMVEEHVAGQSGSDSPLIVTVEHHAGIEPGDVVNIAASARVDGFDLWVTAGDGHLAAVVRAQSL